MKLKPTERLILLALRATPNLTVPQIQVETGISQSYHVLAAIRMLKVLTLVKENDTDPITYSVLAQGTANA